MAYFCLLSLNTVTEVTSRPPKLIVLCPCPVDHLCQFASKSVYRNYCVTNGRTDGRSSDEQRNERTTENIMPLTANHPHNCEDHQS